MRVLRLGYRVLPWFGAIASLLTVGLLGPSTARAGCSTHYVQARTQAFSTLGELELLRLTEGPTPAPDGAGSKGRAPCTGALCSGNPSTPPTATPGVSPVVEGEWAILGAHPRVILSRPFLLPPSDTGLRPIDPACAIFHPPRPAPSLV